jgi:hypothetical protein
LASCDLFKLVGVEIGEIPQRRSHINAFGAGFATESGLRKPTKVVKTASVGGRKPAQKGGRLRGRQGLRLFGHHEFIGAPGLATSLLRQAATTLTGEQHLGELGVDSLSFGIG